MTDLIQEYFYKGFNHEEIRDLLEKEHGLKISLSTLKRNLARLGLKRKNIDESDIHDIVHAVIEELYSSGYNLGYKSLWQKLKQKYNSTVKRETVYQILQIADPDGLSDRFGNKLRRRSYLSPGPNFLWHLDGYDKLKQFGFAIHACIDGYSRNLMWLEVANTNNNPRVTAHYYLSTVKQNQLLPTMIRSDKGSENAIIESLQVCLRIDHEDKLSGDNSYIKGRSVRNQRIESYWGQLRKHTADFYIQLFKSMQQRNIFDGSSLHIKCLQYCFGPMIKADLKLAMELWNNHKIRKQAARNNVAGKPYILYHLAEKQNVREFRKEVDTDVVQKLMDEFTDKPILIDPLFGELIEIILPDAIIPTTPEEALSLYKEILRTVAAS